MHPSSMKLMQDFALKYLPRNPKLSILDVGSCDVNGTYRPLFEGHNYAGLDVAPGPNVHIIGELYEYPIADGSYDVIASGQTAEHVQDVQRWIREIARVCKPGGLVCIIAPNLWEEHRYPVDCWRILPDGMRFLLSEIAGLTVIESYMEGRDTIGIARK